MKNKSESQYTIMTKFETLICIFIHLILNYDQELPLDSSIFFNFALSEKGGRTSQKPF